MTTMQAYCRLKGLTRALWRTRAAIDADASMMATSFAPSAGCTCMNGSGSQRRAPLTSRPTPGTSTATSSTRLATKHQDAYFSHTATGTCSASSPATKPRPSASACRLRKCVDE